MICLEYPRLLGLPRQSSRGKVLNSGDLEVLRHVVIGLYVKDPGHESGNGFVRRDLVFD